MNKTIHFVRHGQSTWNEAEEIFKFTRFDKEMQTLDKMDAPLSSFGEEQAAHLHEKIQALNAEIVITSPLNRAIETCIRSYGVKNVVASHLCAKLGDTICDIGKMTNPSRRSIHRLSLVVCLQLFGGMWMKN